MVAASALFIAIGFSTSTGLRSTYRFQNIGEVQGVRRSHEHCIHFRTGAKLGSRGEGVWNAELSRRFLRALRVAARECGHPAELRLCKSRHQALDRVVSEAGDSEADHAVNMVPPSLDAV